MYFLTWFVFKAVSHLGGHEALVRAQQGGERGGARGRARVQAHVHAPARVVQPEGLERAPLAQLLHRLHHGPPGGPLLAFLRRAHARPHPARHRSQASAA